MSYFTLFVLEGLGSDIVNGKKVPKNLMLYMALVQNSQGQRCGGFLISQDFVLTAAHCNDMWVKYSVVLFWLLLLKATNTSSVTSTSSENLQPSFSARTILRMSPKT